MAAKKKTKQIAPEQNKRLFGGVIVFMLLTLVFDAEVVWRYWF